MMCLAFLAVAYALRLEPEPPQPPKSPLQELRRLASSQFSYDKVMAAESPELAKLITANNSEAADILRGLAKLKPEEDDEGYVRGRVAGSKALKAFVERRPEEAAQVVKDLAKDKDEAVRRSVAGSGALEALVGMRLDEGAQLVRELAKDEKGWVRSEVGTSLALKALVEARPGEGGDLVRDLAADAETHEVTQYLADSSALEAWVKVRPEEGAQVVKDLGINGFEFVRRPVAQSLALKALVEARPEEGGEVVWDLAGDENSDVRHGVADSEALKALVKVRPEEGAEVVWDLVKDENWDVRRSIAGSKALKALVEVRPEEAAQVVKDLAKDEQLFVRAEVAGSAALKALLQVRPEEGSEVVMDLVEKDLQVRIEQTSLRCWPVFKEYATSLADSLNRSLEKASSEERVSLATNSSWRPVMHLNFEEGKRLFAKVIADPDLAVRQAAVDAPAWRAFFAYDLTGALSEFKTLGRSLAKDAADTAAKEKKEKQKAQEAAKKAKNAELKAYKSALEAKAAQEQAQTAAQDAKKAQRQAEEERANAQKAQQRAEEEKAKALQAKKEAEAAQEESEAQRQKAHFMLFLVLLFGALAVFFGTLFWSYPWFCKWREERRIVGKAKEFLSEAETFQIVASLQPIPKPLADLTILKRPDVFNNPYILHRYNCLEPALREAFRLGRLYMDNGLKMWDFSQVIESSGAVSQELATKNYGMAREFLDKQEAAQISTLMLTCDEIKQNLDSYSSDLESIPDAVEACYQMYQQAFVAKRAYFDAMVKQIGQTTGAEARFCGEKGLLRLAEKHCLRPDSGLIWDGIRAMLVGKSLDQLSKALHGLQAEQKAGRLKIIQINNRFAKPTQDNWQDIAVYVMFNDSRFSGIVGEIQLVHETFLAVRTHFKAHDAYDGIRFAAEALKRKNKEKEIRGLPDSQRSNPAP